MMLPEDRSGSPSARLTQPGGVSRYTVAIGALAAALLFRYFVRDSLGLKVPYLQFYPAIIVAAWYGGLGPGVLSTTLSTLAAMYFFLPPTGFAAGEASDQLSLGVFVATGIVISWLNHHLHLAEEAQRTAASTATARAERLDAILNTTVDGIIVIDVEGKIEAFNPGAVRLFGYPESEVVGRNVSLLMPSPYHEEHDGYLQRYLATGHANIIGKGREVTGRHRDGTIFPLHLSIGEMTLGGQRKFTGMLHDLTERVRLAGELGSSEARWRAVVDSAEDGIIVIDAHGRVEAFNPAAERLFGHSAKEVLALKDVHVEVEGAAPTLSADPDMLRIVFQNLLINGVHAMKGKGRIRIAIHAVDSTCQIAFIDSGPGIPVDIREEIFTPFFTTKSRGSGLGLPTAKRLIEAHHGQIVIDCPPAGGTAVVVHLPIGRA